MSLFLAMSAYPKGPLFPCLTGMSGSSKAVVGAGPVERPLLFQVHGLRGRADDVTTRLGSWVFVGIFPPRSRFSHPRPTSLVVRAAARASEVYAVLFPSPEFSLEPPCCKVTRARTVADPNGNQWGNGAMG